MKYSQQMYNYGEGKYRFISYEPLIPGDIVDIIGRQSNDVVTEVMETKVDGGRWDVYETIVSPEGERVKGKKLTLLTNIIKIKYENIPSTIQVQSKRTDTDVADNSK